MRIKTLIAGTAMVLAFGVGSAIASDTVENTATAPQHLTLLSDGLLANVAPMPAAQLEAVRGTWWTINPKSPLTKSFHDAISARRGGP